MRDFLADLFARLRATNRQERLYLGLAVVVGLFVLRFGFTWFVDYRDGMKDDIRLSAERLANARRLVARGPEIAKELEQLRARYREATGQLIPGDSPTLAAAALQERVSMLAGQKNVSVQTTQVMKDEPLGPFRKVSLRVTASADLRELADFLTSLEFGPLRVSVPFIELSRRGVVMRGQVGRAVAATLEIGGILQGSATAAAVPASSAGEATQGAGGSLSSPPAGGVLPPPNIPPAGGVKEGDDPLGTANLGNDQ
ncbi:MAG TPA: type II secretion system protein GspM [Candidatus Bathyarchaeia archaeon]|nr:type II secretion system protein GspM [Candidatus Bathyarchaeia archaeon]